MSEARRSGTGGRRLPPWVHELRRFERPSTWRATWQLVSTLGAYTGAVVAMYLTIRHGLPYWVTLLIAVPGAGFLVRSFILFHDCVHGSFVASQRACRIVGRVLGLLVFAPFEHWRRSHLVHHATAGDLDRRGTGDVWTLTTDEYRSGRLGLRLMYRLYRSPIGLFGFGPIVSFLIAQRIPPAGDAREQRRSVLWTNVALGGVVAVATLTVGIETYVAIQLPLILFGGVAGIWLFYVQHQFDPSYWRRGDEWDAVAAAMQGSSYYRLPKVLQWFSGNIGLHHVHHLRPRIPNYRLQASVDATPELQIPPVTPLGSVRSLRLRLWDERTRTLVGYREARRLQCELEPPGAAEAPGRAVRTLQP